MRLAPDVVTPGSIWHASFVSSDFHQLKSHWGLEAYGGVRENSFPSKLPDLPPPNIACSTTHIVLAIWYGGGKGRLKNAGL